MAQPLVHDGLVASAATYAEAQGTVEYLRNYGMAGESLLVVGSELRLAERRTGTSVPRLTAVTAGVGGGLGLLMGVFVTLVADTSMTGLLVVAWGAVYGGIVGALVGLFRGLIRNRPEAVSTEVVPTRYEIRCPAAEASVAIALLHQDQAA